MAKHNIQTFEVTPDVMNGATEVGPAAKLITMQLREMHVESLPIDDDDIAVRLGYTHETEIAIETKSVTAAIEFTLHLAKNNEDAKKSPEVEVRARYAAEYEIESIERFEKTALENFALVNGMFNVWPFWRELAQSILSRVGISGYLLPTLRVKVVKAKKAESKTMEDSNSPDPVSK
jgi:hypothetical protein